MKSTEQQKIIISKYKAKSQKIQHQLWSTVPGIRKKYYYKTKQRTTRRAQTSTASGANSRRRNTSTRRSTTRVTEIEGINNETTPHGFVNQDATTRMQSIDLSSPRKFHKRKCRPEKIHHQQDSVAIETENAAMNEVAKLIESCSFHHPVPEENPNIREIPDRNFGVLFVVYTHLKDR